MHCVHRKVLAYCIVHVVKTELKEFQADWNSHHLRHNNKSRLPSGRPDDLFDMPELYGD